jgi:hypothetical protein
VSQPLTPDFIQLLVTQTTQAVLAAMDARTRLVTPEGPTALATIPAAPPQSEPLPAPVLDLWRGDEPAVSRRETHQLAMIAAEYDGPTGGHGAYWLGRAILMADLCLNERGQVRSLPYLRQILRRWREEGSWGSDREVQESPPRPPTSASSRLRPAVEAVPEEAHPAVVAYVEALHEAPNAVQAAQIAATVTNIDTWRQVLHDWQLNGWGERSVGKMLDRYQKNAPGAATAAGAEPAPSAMPIHTHPSLSDEQRDRWIRRFRAALNPLEQRAILARLEQEHPRPASTRPTAHTAACTHTGAPQC